MVGKLLQTTPEQGKTFFWLNFFVSSERTGSGESFFNKALN